MQPDDYNGPPSGSARASVFAALATATVVLLLLRLGSGHTAASRRFAGRPDFSAWTWTYAAYGACAAVAGIATWPAFRHLSRRAGRRATLSAVTAWAAAGILITRFGPTVVGLHSPLWLQYERATLANVLCGVFVTPSFAGLLLVQTRLSTLGRETASRVQAEQGGAVIVELLWLRSALQRFLVSFGVLISAGVLGVAALRRAVLADGVPAEAIPDISLLIYGAFFTGLAALVFVPTYVAWKERVVNLRDQLYPIPPSGRSPHDWHQGRNDFDLMLSAQEGAGSAFIAAFGVLAPLASSLVSALVTPS